LYLFYVGVKLVLPMQGRT